MDETFQQYQNIITAMNLGILTLEEGQKMIEDLEDYYA